MFNSIVFSIDIWHNIKSSFDGGKYTLPFWELIFIDSPMQLLWRNRGKIAFGPKHKSWMKNYHRRQDIVPEDNWCNAFGSIVCQGELFRDSFIIFRFEMVQTIKKDFVVVYIPTRAFNKQFPRLNNIKELQVLESDKQACC